MKKIFVDERYEWLSFTPAQRIMESGKLWKLYLLLGGSFEPESDSQSPFNFQEIQSKKPSNRRSSMHSLRRHRI